MIVLLTEKNKKPYEWMFYHVDYVLVCKLFTIFGVFKRETSQNFIKTDVFFFQKNVSFYRICSHLPEKSLMENFIFVQCDTSFCLLDVIYSFFLYLSTLTINVISSLHYQVMVNVDLYDLKTFLKWNVMKHLRWFKFLQNVVDNLRYRVTGNIFTDFKIFTTL